MLASVQELERELGTAGTIATRPAAGSAGAVPPTLVADLLARADSALKARVPDRTLEREGTLGEPVTRVVPAHAQTIRVPDLAELVEARADGRAIALDRIRLVRRHPDEPAIYVRVRERLFAEELELVGVWGPADSRDDSPAPHVKGAALAWARAAFHARQSRGADQVRDPNGAVASYFRSVPPDVAGVIGDLTIPGL